MFATTVARSSGLAANASSLVTIKDAELKGTDEGDLLTFKGIPSAWAELPPKAGQPAYFFRFSYVPQAQGEKLPRATHGAEIAFAFDAVSAVFRDEASPSDDAENIRAVVETRYA